MWAIAGKTGTGKTTFVKEFIRLKRRVKPSIITYYLDSKKLGDFSNRDGKIIRSFLAPHAETNPGAIQIWQPEEDDIDQYSQWFMNILKAGLPAIVDVNETANLVFGEQIPRGYKLITKQGRLAGIHVISETQEVAQSPRQMFSQSTHIVCFNVFNAYDANTLKRYLRMYGKEGDIRPKKKHGFFYINTDIDGIATEYDNYTDFFNEFF